MQQLQGATWLVPSPAAPSVLLPRRVVSRGRPSSRASDFGGLEVFGHASIGNTDPYAVFAALQEQWAVQCQENAKVDQ